MNLLLLLLNTFPLYVHTKIKIEFTNIMCMILNYKLEDIGDRRTETVESENNKKGRSIKPQQYLYTLF